MTFKTITLLKRRADLTLDQFIERYETGHAQLGARLLRGRASHYARRFLRPVPNPETGAVAEGEYDVVMEIWYPDRATWEATMAHLSAPEVMAEIVADEETLFDRAKNRFFLVEEHASDMG
jgi:hypothetical protein